MQSGLFVKFLDVRDGHTEKQVHDDDGNDENKHCEDCVGCDGEVLELSDLFDLSCSV